MKAKGIPDPNWLAGFTDAEGCFFVTINKSDKSRLGESVGLKFLITQHRRDGEPMESLITILGCGRIEANSDGSVVNLVVTRFQDITDKIIPFFERYPLQGAKALEFSDFKRVANLMKNKAHLTKE